jgi:two-component system NtrC family sensor kinase
MASDPIIDPGHSSTADARAASAAVLSAQQVQALIRSNEALVELNSKLQLAQDQLMQSEKLASIGQLAAGVAHEINNPVGYVFSNFGTLERYLADLFRMLGAYEEAEPLLANTPAARRLAALRAEIELDYLKEDVPTLMAESCEGIKRVRKIVQDLKDFSHVDARQEWEWVDLHKGIDSTLNIVNNEIKYKADVVKQYGALPEVECLPSELNQVFMNLLVNAAHAVSKERGTITIRSGASADGAQVWVEIEDDGCGIARENLSRVFDPFFTTKPVGKGTGLGLSLSYGIVKKHGGRLELDSEVGRGTRFRVSLPVRRDALERA